MSVASIERAPRKETPPAPSEDPTTMTSATAFQIEVVAAAASSTPVTGDDIEMTDSEAERPNPGRSEETTVSNDSADDGALEEARAQNDNDNYEDDENEEDEEEIRVAVGDGDSTTGSDASGSLRAVMTPPPSSRTLLAHVVMPATRRLGLRSTALGCRCTVEEEVHFYENVDEYDLHAVAVVGKMDGFLWNEGKFHSL
jgi:hypothetical protein